MRKKILKGIAITLVSLLCAALLALGVLWLLNEYKVINVQSFLDYLYYHALAIVAGISALGVGGVVSIIVSLFYNTYKISQAQQVIDTKVSLLRIAETMDVIKQSNENILAKQTIIENQLRLLLNYETIMANKNLSSAILGDGDKSNLKSWIVSTALKSSELAGLAKKVAPIMEAKIVEAKPTVEETKKAVTAIMESPNVDDDIKKIIKGMF